MAELATAIGLFDTSISLFGSLTDAIFPKADKPDVAQVRVSVGNLDSEDDLSRSLGGDSPGVALFDAVGFWCGKAEGHTSIDLPGHDHIDRSGHRDYTIKTQLTPEYISVTSGGNNGICIHSVTVNAKGIDLIWTGDMGKMCGAEWYPQSDAINPSSYRPACIWIDNNGDDGHIWKGFNIHMQSFSAPAEVQEKRVTQWNEAKDLVCKSEPRFSMYTDINLDNVIRVFKEPWTPDADGLDNKTQVLEPSEWAWSHAPGSRSDDGCAKRDDLCRPSGASFSQDLKEKPVIDINARRRKRSIVKRQPWMADRLIVSNFPEHSATELCESGTSNGPDFVSIQEGLFCDMSEKQLYPLCSETSTSYCFEMNSQTIRGSTVAASTLQSNANIAPFSNSTSLTGISRVSLTGPPVKSYTSTQTWG